MWMKWVNEGMSYPLSAALWKFDQKFYVRCHYIIVNTRFLLWVVHQLWNAIYYPCADLPAAAKLLCMKHNLLQKAKHAAPLECEFGWYRRPLGPLNHLLHPWKKYCGIIKSILKHWLSSGQCVKWLSDVWTNLGGEGITFILVSGGNSELKRSKRKSWDLGKGQDFIVMLVWLT